MRYFELKDGCLVASSGREEEVWLKLSKKELTKEEYEAITNPEPPKEKDEDKLKRNAGKILLELSKEDSAALVLTKLKQLVQEALDG